MEMMTNYDRYYLLGLLFLLLPACGGGDDAAPAGPPPNESGYPNVVGTYAFNTTTFNYSCTDGETGTSPAVSFNIGISQSLNSLTLLNKSTGGTPGVTILESSGMTGNVTKSSSFTTSETATALVDGITGQVTIIWNLSGQFTSSSWSGNYQFTATGIGFSCTYKSTFSGEKISAQASLTTIKTAPQMDVYDPYHAIGQTPGN